MYYHIWGAELLSMVKTLTNYRPTMPWVYDVPSTNISHKSIKVVAMQSELFMELFLEN